MRRSVGARVRCNLIVAMGDLAVRFPNVLEPWTSHMYQPLSDADLGEALTNSAISGAFQTDANLPALCCKRDLQPQLQLV